MPIDDGSNGGLSQRLCLDEPLLTGYRLDHCLATVAVSYRVDIRLNLYQKPFLFQVSNYRPAAGKAVELDIRSGIFIHGGIRVEYVYR